MMIHAGYTIHLNAFEQAVCNEFAKRSAALGRPYNDTDTDLVVHRRTGFTGELGFAKMFNACPDLDPTSYAASDFTVPVGKRVLSVNVKTTTAGSPRLMVSEAQAVTCNVYVLMHVDDNDWSTVMYCGWARGYEIEAAPIETYATRVRVCGMRQSDFRTAGW